MDERPANDRRSAGIGFVIVGLLLPTLITWIYFTLLASCPASLQKSAFLIGKSAQFGLPVIALLVLAKWCDSSQPHFRRSLIIGTVSGLLIAITIYVLNRFVLMPFGVMDLPTIAIKEKLNETGLTSLPIFIAVAIGYTLIHSLMEEYYWRWFIFGNLCKLMRLEFAIMVSSIGFMSHHVLVLRRYFGWDNPWTYITAAGVATGGVIWAWTYCKTGTIVGSWLSHAAVDAAIFFVGYELAFAS